MFVIVPSSAIDPDAVPGAWTGCSVSYEYDEQPQNIDGQALVFVLCDPSIQRTVLALALNSMGRETYLGGSHQNELSA